MEDDMDLSTKYLGLDLAHPIMVGASPLVDDMDKVRRLEDAGAAAIVMHSLFEEQITREQLGTVMDIDVHENSFAEALSYFPEPADYRLGPEAYLDQIRKVKAAVSCPVIGSLNGATGKGWVEYAKKIEQAGADALELNIYYVSQKFGEDAAAVEGMVLGIVKGVKAAVGIPVSVKLSPYFTALRNFAGALVGAGADGLVMFNRFYQPDIDIEALEPSPTLHLSDSSELLLRLRWTAILRGQVMASLAVSGGVHTPVDAIKAVMAGADAVQVVSAALKGGPEVVKALREGMAQWMEAKEYASLTQMKGSMSLLKSPNPEAFERANYMRILNSWR
jgi:dihydroorotate dehydrogenase (fumarate)